MNKRRMIPVVLLRNGWLVQSIQFSRYRNLGNPVWTVKRLSEWASDELIYLDITADEHYDMRRDDLGAANRSSFLEIIADVAKSVLRSAPTRSASIPQLSTIPSSCAGPRRSSDRNASSCRSTIRRQRMASG
jgi:hypothetical protein